MAFRVLINHRHTLKCEPGTAILTAARDQGFDFPHACRNGVCHRCQGYLTAGAVRHSVKGNITHANGPGDDQVLYCVAIPISDCEIHVPEITAPGEVPIHRVQCQILKHEPLNHDVTRVWLRLPAGRAIRWHAGQYLTLMLEHGDYPFSIANPPGGRDLELHVRHGDDNSAAHAIMKDLKTLATITVEIPGGQRFIDQPPHRPLWFICGSTGFAPAKAMIEHLIELDFPHPIRLFWGARTEQDLYLPKLPAQWAHALADFHATTALSNTRHPDHIHGLAHEAALQALVEPREPLFYIHGSPTMAWSVFDDLVAAGVPAEHIHSDVFDYAPR